MCKLCHTWPRLEVEMGATPPLENANCGKTQPTARFIRIFGAVLPAQLENPRLARAFALMGPGHPILFLGRTERFPQKKKRQRNIIVPLTKTPSSASHHHLSPHGAIAMIRKISGSPRHPQMRASREKKLDSQSPWEERVIAVLTICVLALRGSAGQGFGLVVSHFVVVVGALKMVCLN